MSLQEEIEALTHSISHNGSEDEKLDLILDFNKRALSEMGFAFSLNAIKNNPHDASQLKSAGCGYLSKGHKLKHEAELMLSASRMLLSIMGGSVDVDPDDVESFIHDINTMHKEYKKQIIINKAFSDFDEASKDMPQELRKILRKFLGDENGDN